VEINYILTEEEQNIKKRKSVPLTAIESLIFFFIPFSFFGSINKKNTDFNKSEIKRFKKHGYDLKVKQAKELSIYGKIFYFSLIIIIIYLIN
jgi:hypothetical protein